MSKHDEYLEKLTKMYEALPEFYGSELKMIDTLASKLEETRDPEWLSFREHPTAIRLYENAVKIYRTSCMQMINDEGEMSKDDRIKLHISKQWALWYIRALGGNPRKIKEEVEKEIEKFAESSGISLSTDRV